jgi:hypothetical protein
MLSQAVADSTQKKVGFIKNSTLIFAAFCTAFYSRIFCSITHAPSILNFLHFPVVIFVTAVVMSTSRTRDRQQIRVVWLLIVGLTLFLCVMIASAILNDAGIPNVIFNFLILGEPFMFLIAVASFEFQEENLNKLRHWLIISAVINLILAIAQKFLLLAGKISAAPYNETDGVQGVFFISGAGGYISAAVSVSVSIYSILYLKSVPLWLRILGLVGTVYQIQIADTKQVLLVSGLAWIVLGLSKVQDIKKFLIYVTCITIALGTFYWAAYNIEMFKVYGGWMNRDDINNDSTGGGMWVKTEGIRRVLSYYRSPLHPVLGLGPGHTLGRLGGWTINDYWSIFSKIGATKHPLYDQMWYFINHNWIAWSTTLYVPLFTWAGLWGDQGWLGVAVYLYLGFVVWRYFCVDDYCRFLVITIFIYGFFLTQVEEPGFMLSMVILIGLRWHEHRLLQKRLKRENQTSLLPQAATL